MYKFIFGNAEFLSRLVAKIRFHSSAKIEIILPKIFWWFGMKNITKIMNLPPSAVHVVQASVSDYSTRISLIVNLKRDGLH